ncbi:MAG: thioredoxin domain-containing protein [Aerococcus sp.]|nr:thioredoxin domain-containing protein [Aerococcus sp.]
MIELTKENWEQEVENSDQPVVIDWWGETCTNCKAFMPTMEAIAEENKDDFKFASFNTSQKGVRRFCIKHRILGLPVVSVYKNGEKVGEVGKDDMTRENVEALLADHKE